nr:MAG TPA: hypothetical protein [Caudoviricetes sp.]
MSMIKHEKVVLGCRLLKTRNQCPQHECKSCGWNDDVIARRAKNRRFDRDEDGLYGYRYRKD